MVADSLLDPGYKRLHSEKYGKTLQFKIYHFIYFNLSTSDFQVPFVIYVPLFIMITM